ncbi:MAG: DEAD/DEAH box helicase [Planctomycetes bacterium]|nr:DEAD/DEAH box helicase [Planctomycetota bacterium]
MPSLAHAFRSDFDAPTRTRGERYARCGYVTALVPSNPREFCATVEGSTAYELEVSILGDDDAPDFDVQAIVAQCSCPVGLNCKHAVAALLVWASTQGHSLVPGPGRAAPPPKPPAQLPDLFPGVSALRDRAWRNSDPDVRAWLADWHDGGRLRAEGDGTQHLVHVVNNSDEAGLSIVPVVCRRLKSGARGLAKRFSSYDAFLHNPPRCAGRDDERLVAMLRGLSLGRGWQFSSVGRERETMPAALLEMALDTGRAHWGSYQGPALVRLPPITATAIWRRNGKSRRIELVDAADAALEVLAVEPPWVRTPAGVAPLASTLEPALLRKVVAMPWMDPIEAQVASGMLATSQPTLALPDVQAPEVATPCLRIARTRLGWYVRGQRRERDADLAVASFRYPGGEVGCGGAPVIEGVDGTPILRHLADEQARCAELARFGLAPWPPPGTQAVPLKGVGSALLWARCADLLAAGEDAVTMPVAALAALQGSGWEISGVDVGTITEVDLGGITAQVEEHDAGDWFELHLGMEVGGQRIDLVPLLAPLLAGGPAAWERLPRSSGDQPVILVAAGAMTVLRVPLSLLQDLHGHLMELYDQPAGPGGGWRIDAARADIIEALDRLSPRWLGERRLRAVAERMRSCLTPPAVRPPAGLGLTLRSYQVEGLSWLQHLRGLGLGGILADDMGLGKTAQAIAHLLTEYLAGRDDRASLVICPASMVGPWRKELARAAPGLRVAVLHGAGRATVGEVEADVIVTTHATLARDEEAFAARPWHVAVCDEAQAMKNPTSRLAATVRRLDTRQRVCLTGTPVENHLGELHTLLSWVAPGALGSARGFARTFRAPIETQDDPARRALLRRRIAPFLLRRTKEAVASELPARTEIDVTVELPPAQRALYDALRLAMDERVRAVIAERGLKRSGLQILEALLRLRQACCDPRLLPGKLAARCTESAKLDALGELLGTLLDEGRRVLVFSQFTALLDLVESDVLAPRKVACLRLDGQSRGRERLVERFQGGECAVFLLSLKAGGTGLTLTAADSVILLDPWWNPAVERQAADRVHRIGQTRPVTIYRLIVAGTVEERIRKLQARKAALADALVDEDGQALGRLELADIEALLAPLGEDGVGLMG